LKTTVGKGQTSHLYAPNAEEKVAYVNQVNS